MEAAVQFAGGGGDEGGARDGGEGGARDGGSDEGGAQDSGVDEGSMRDGATGEIPTKLILMSTQFQNRSGCLRFQCEYIVWTENEIA